MLRILEALCWVPRKIVTVWYGISLDVDPKTLGRVAGNGVASSYVTQLGLRAFGIGLLHASLSTASSHLTSACSVLGSSRRTQSH